MQKLKKRISVWWWRQKPRPCPITDKEHGYRKLVEWCRKGEQVESISCHGTVI